MNESHLNIHAYYFSTTAPKGSRELYVLSNASNARFFFGGGGVNDFNFFRLFHSILSFFK